MRWFPLLRRHGLFTALLGVLTACGGVDSGVHVVVNGPQQPLPDSITVTVTAADGRELASEKLQGADVHFPARFNFLVEKSSKTRPGASVLVTARAEQGGTAWKSDAESVELAARSIAPVVLFLDSPLVQQPNNTVDAGIPGPDSLVFVSAPQLSLASGGCSSAFKVELRDEGEPYPATANVPLTVTATPATNLNLFADDGCSTPLTELFIPSGSTQAQFFIRSTRMGAVKLDVSSPGLAVATQGAQVGSGAPAALLFTTTAATKRAGECSAPVTVKLVDGEGTDTLAMAPISVALAANPIGRLSFYSDAACSTAITSATIPMAAGSTTFYFKGLGNAASVTASVPGLVVATQMQNVLPVVRRNTCTLPATQTSVTCPVSPAQVDLAKTLLLFQATSSDNTPAGANVQCTLSSTTQITCNRSGNTGAVSIGWQTAELAEGLKVTRPAAVNCSGGPTLTFPIPEVNPANTFVLHGRTSGGTENSENDFATVKIAGATSVEIKLAGTLTGQNDCRTQLQLAEFTGANVVRSEIALAGRSVEATNLPAADLTRSVLFYTLRTTSTGTLMCERMVRGAIATSTTLSFNRANGANGCTGTGVEAISFERVDFGPRATVQQVPVTMNAGTASVNTTIQAVDPSRTLVFSSGQVLSGAGTGEGSFSTDDVIGEMVGVHTLSDSTTLKVERGSSVGSAAWTSYAVQFEP